MNDEERRQWVENDEGLHSEYRHSLKSMRLFIKENRKFIDECIDNVVNGKKPAHYLMYFSK